MLKIDNLSVHYGGIHALQGIHLEVADGKIVTLIGANGAGKSTTLKAIVGLVKASSGNVDWNGEILTGKATKDIVQKGVVLVPEGRRIFPNLTVDENLSLGAYARNDKPGIAADRERVFSLFPRLKERMKQKGGTLSGGEQQMLAVARALMTRPALLMMDEPSLGLAPLIVKMIFEIVREINKTGTTVLLVEQNAKARLVEATKIPFYPVATDLNTGETVTLEKGSLAKAIHASSAIPGIFVPVTFGNRTLVDGGVTSNIACDVARAKGANVIIAVNLQKDVRDTDITSVIDVIAQSISIMMHVNTRSKLAQADVIIEPDTKGISMFDFSLKKTLMEEGMKATEIALPRIKALTETK
jgi:branched-chain amino acid transport system ATP-binding protein